MTWKPLLTERLEPSESGECGMCGLQRIEGLLLSDCNQFAGTLMLGHIRALPACSSVGILPKRPASRRHPGHSPIKSGT